MGLICGMVQGLVISYFYVRVSLTWSVKFEVSKFRVIRVLCNRLTKQYLIQQIQINDKSYFVTYNIPPTFFGLYKAIITQAVYKYTNTANYVTHVPMQNL